MVEKLMKKLGCTETEALEIIEADKAIDKGVKLFELSPEQEQASKKARQADSKPRNKPTVKEKKVDNDKLHLMKVIETAIKYNPNCDNYEAINPEREAVFHFKGRKYKIVLSCPRS